MAPPIKNARDCIDGIGFNLGNGSLSMNTIAAALGFTCCRWFRIAAEGYQGLATGLQNGLVATGQANPNLKVMMLTTAYAQNGDSFNWTTVQIPFILGTALNNLDANGHSTLWAIEGPNEVNAGEIGGGQGGGTFHVNTTNYVQAPWGGGEVDTDSILAYREWAAAEQTFYNSNSTTLNSKGHNIEVYAPTFSGFYFTPWPSCSLTASNIQYGNIHWYAAYPPGIQGANGSASLPVQMRAASQSFWGNTTAPLILTEGPIYGPGYAGSDTADNQALGRGNALAWCDFFAQNGHRMFYFELTQDPTNQGGQFGVAFQSNGTTKLAFAYMLNNMNNILSIGNSYGGSANLTDMNTKPTFTPTFNSAGVTVSSMPGGMVGDAGNLLIMPKADTNTVIAVWNEVGYTGNTSPPATAVTVNFGSIQTYKVYDISGSGGNSTMNPTTSTTPYKSGTGSSVGVNLFGMPVFIELIGPGVGGGTFTPPTVGSVSGQAPAPGTPAGHLLIL